jgi:hypothetical protein
MPTLADTNESGESSQECNGEQRERRAKKFFKGIADAVSLIQ